jgi:colanic acid biosynthesis glycosyl transferase WcaI
MRVLFIAQNFFPEQLSNNSLAASLVDRGHEVEVITQVPNYGKESFFDGYSNSTKRSETWNGLNIFRAFTIARGKRSLTLAANYLCFPLTATWTMWRSIKKRPDVVFVSLTSPIFQAFPAVVLRRLTGVPVVLWVQDIWPEALILALGIKNPMILKALMWLCGKIYRSANLVLVQSEAFPAMIKRFGVQPEKIRFLPNSAPPSFRRLMRADTPIPELEPFLDKFKIMFAGNIGVSQDFETIIRTAELLRECNLVWIVVGSGRELDNVKARISRLSLDESFLFLGRHPEERMPEFFAHADAMLVSLEDEYIFSLTIPYKIQCYMACGKPILISVSGEGKRVVEHAGAGFGAQAEKPEELSMAAKRLMEMSEADRMAMGDRGISYFQKHFTHDIVYGNFEKWLIEAASENKNSKQ